MTIINLVSPSFMVGDSKPDLLNKLENLNIRPIYGPKNSKGTRPLVGCIAVGYVEKLVEQLAKGEEK